MSQCTHCGANLPDEAHYCMQCGTPAGAPPPQPVSTQPPPKLDFLQPALAGGLTLGLLSAIPFIAFGNCICCMWILGGGALTAYMLMQQRPAGITYGDAAFGGVLSGLIGAIVSTIINIPIHVLAVRMMGSGQPGFLDPYLKEMPEGPMRDLMNRLVSDEISPVTILATLVPNMIAFSLFAMLGGILLVAIMEKRKKGK